jgi:hypothetical protein
MREFIYLNICFKNMSKEQIIEEAMRLSDKDREEVAELLLLTRSGGYSPEEIGRLWSEELRRRLLNLKAGNAVLHDGNTVIEEALSRLRNREV